MKLIIAGSRSITDIDILHKALREFALMGRITTVVSGCAKGVDILGEQIAKEKGFCLRQYPADWDMYGRKAGHIRNMAMGDYADALLAIWDGKSAGTKHMISYMRALDKPVYTFVPGITDGPSIFDKEKL